MPPGNFRVPAPPPVAIAASLDAVTGSSTMVQDETSVDDEGLSFRLSEGPNQPEVRPATNPVPATLLSKVETEAVLKRLPATKSDTKDETDFVWRERSLAPPRTGITVMQPFLTTNEIAAPGPATAGTLEVIRFSPEGEVPVAPNLSITFFATNDHCLFARRSG